MIESDPYAIMLQNDSAQFDDTHNQRQALEKAIRDNSRERYQFHQERIERDKRERDELLKSRTIALKEKMAKDKAQKEKIEAAVFRRLLNHLQENRDLQNIDLMNLAGFCRNCLYKWMHEAASDSNEDLSIEEAQKHVYGMPYEDWKKKFQK